jgi:hypothetical protein
MSCDFVRAAGVMFDSSDCFFYYCAGTATTQQGVMLLHCAGALLVKSTAAERIALCDKICETLHRVGKTWTLWNFVMSYTRFIGVVASYFENRPVNTRNMSLCEM